jgi:hypothetical protein
MRRRFVPVVALAGVVLVSCGGPEGGARTPQQTSTRTAGALQVRIAHALAQASPPADPKDAAARDAAAERLVHVRELLEATGERILWGGFEAAKGFDLDTYRLTEFSPVVWTKLYLSTFMFPGEYEVRREGKYTVLQMAAQFRAGLDPGDYPYPFWHTPQKWQAYVGTRALLMVFENDVVVAAFRDAPPGAGAGVAAAKPWDGQWQWTDATGRAQPHVTLYSYLLSSDNPQRTSLDRAYRKLEAAFRGQNCMGCHAPDNVAKASPLLLLNYPNQALAGRHALVEVLRQNKMPPADPETGLDAGITDESARQELLRLAEDFEREADAALAHEQQRR